MNMNRPLRVLLLLVLCVVGTSCYKPSARQPSPAFTNFDFAQLLKESGFKVQELPGERTTNSATGRAQILGTGTFTAPASGFACYKVYEAVNKRLDAAAGGKAHQEGWIPQRPEHPATPVRITTFYNRDYSGVGRLILVKRERKCFPEGLR